MIVIESVSNSAVKKAAALLRTAERKKQARFIAEGTKLVREAADSGFEIESLFYVPELAGFADSIPAQNRTAVSERVVGKLSSQVSPQGVVAVVKRPDAARPLKKDGRFLLIENLQDPGNVGNIARSAECFGFDGLILVGDCADPFSPKTLRGSMGSMFRIGLYSFATAKEAALALKKCKIALFCARLDKSALPPEKIPKSAVCVAIGNESRGLTGEMIAEADGSVYIPMRGRAESLSAQTAAAILMWECGK